MQGLYGENQVLALLTIEYQKIDRIIPKVLSDMSKQNFSCGSRQMMMETKGDEIKAND